MNPTSQAQELFAPVQHLCSDGVSMAMEGMEASQESAKTAMQSGFSLAAASAKDNVKYTGEMVGHVTTAATQADTFIRAQAALVTDLPKDPMGTAQRMLAGWMDGYQKSVAIGTDALKTYASMVGQAWGNLEKASQESRQIYTDLAGKLQGIVDARVKKD
jgi:hypothetical protein